MTLPPIDKQAHFWAGSAISATVALYFDPFTAILACVWFAAIKEFVDGLGLGTRDKWDFVATICGLVVLLPSLF